MRELTLSLLTILPPQAETVAGRGPSSVNTSANFPSFTYWLVPLCAALTLLPQVSGAEALIAGIAIALIWGNPYQHITHALSRNLLQVAVIGLGAAMNLAVVGRVGVAGIGYTMVGLTLTIFLGVLLGRWLGIQQNASLLISVGTAICGGSAIAATAPVLRARPHEISVSLVVVFALNAVALLLFPAVGHALHLTDRQFGLWCALAIHDTSSVVGAALTFGHKALEIATTVKLARALWIVPVTLLIGFVYAAGNETPAEKEAVDAAAEDGGKSTKQGGQYPWFILGFLAMAAFFTAYPALHAVSQDISAVAKQALVLTLFLIGLCLNRAAVRETGSRPFVQGIVLWLCAGTGTLVAILAGWIS